jgi:acyl carrier protein
MQRHGSLKECKEMREEVAREITCSIAHILESDPGNIHQDRSIADIGMDSLQTLQLIVEIERKFGIEMEETDITPLSTVQSLAEVVGRGPRNANATEAAGSSVVQPV